MPCYDDFKLMKTAEEMLKEQEPSCYPDIIILMEEYAEQFKPKWIPVNKFPLQDGMYLQAIRYGINLYPDTVCFDNRGFYSMRENKIVNDVAYLMEFASHPLDDGSGILINLVRS